MSNFKLNKSQRLKSKKIISALFTSGQKTWHGPYLLLWLMVPSEDKKASIQFGVTVSKRKFRRAVDRNVLKRRIRESYRLNPPYPISDKIESGKSYALFVVYMDKTIMEFSDLNLAMKILLEKWKKKQK